MILAAQDYTAFYATAALAVVTVLILAVLCFMKGKPGFALLGIFLAGIFAIVGAIRVAKPGSWWANRYYEPGSAKEQLARQRFPAVDGPQRQDEYWDDRTNWGV
jgi:hypothetical protein